MTTFISPPAVAAIAATLLCAGLASAAMTSSTSKADFASLEKKFWTCDYVATAKGVQFTPIALCVAATERLKDRKFGGDYDALVNWWRTNKASAYLAIEQAAGKPGDNP